MLLDFERYGEWNPFHRRVDVVEHGDGVAVRMTVAMGGLLGELVSTEQVWYVDSERHILAYGINGRDGPSSLRVVYLESRAEEGEGAQGTTTKFHSYDVIGGYPALLSRGYIASLVHAGFTAQHAAIRVRAESLVEVYERPNHGVGAKEGTPTTFWTAYFGGGF